MNSMTRIITRLLVISLLAFAAACSDTSDKVIYDGDIPTAPAADTSSSDPEPEPEPGNIVEVADDAGSFTTLLAAAQKAGLVDALSDDGASLTVFAPSDEAFAALGVSIDDLSEDDLADILLYHVVDGAVSVDDAGALAPSAVATLSGEKVALTKPGDGNLYVNFSKVVSYDIEASNGVIHVIDKVLLPPDMTLAASTITEIVVASENFTALEAAVTKASLAETLADEGAVFTVFAPTDAAFEALSIPVDVLSDDGVANVLLYHVISHDASAGDDAISSVDALVAMNGDSLDIEMANGDTATISISEMGLKINDANVVTYDIVAANGVIHVIDTVLQPSAAERVSMPILDAGVVSAPFQISAFDAAIGYGGCPSDPAGCPSIGWDVAFDSDRGDVLEVTHSADSVHAGLVFDLPATDLSAYAEDGIITFDIKLVNSNTSGNFDMKVDCIYPCSTGERAIDLEVGKWVTMTFNVADLVASSANYTGAPLTPFSLSTVNTGLVVIPAYADSANVVYRIDNVRWYIPPTPILENEILDAGVVSAPFQISAFDAAIGYGGCPSDPAGCPSIGWDVAFDSDRGDVLEVTHSADSVHAGLVFDLPATDLSAYAEDGIITFDIKLVNSNTSGNFDMKVDCIYPCSTGERAIDLEVGKWVTMTFNVADLVASSANYTGAPLTPFSLSTVNTGLVVIPAYADSANVVYRIDNVRWYIPPTPILENEILDAGVVSAPFQISAFDAAIGYGGCPSDPAGCPSIGWDVAFDSDRGDVLEVTHSADSVHAGLVFDLPATDLSAYAEDGIITFDIKLVNSNTSGNFDMKVDCIYPCSTGERAIDLEVGKWVTMTFNVADLVASSANYTGAPLTPFSLSTVNTGLVVIPAYADSANVVYHIDNVRWYIP